MAQSGFTPIILYHSDTTTNVPTTIVSGELAANTVDGKLFLGTGTNTYKTLLNVGSSTITVGGNVTFSGAFSTTLTVTGTTTGTLPTSGYLISSVTNMAANPVTGTPSSTTYLRGDGTWATIAAQVYPSAGIPNSTGSAWGTSYSTTGSGTVVALATSPTFSTSVLGDFSNATVASRTLFKTSTTNATTGIYAVPNGTATAASWQATNAADPTNASKILIATNGSTDVQLVSGINGTGTYLPLSFYTNGSQSAQLDTSANFKANGQLIAGNGLVINANTVSSSYTIASGQNAMSVGPITVATGKSVTIPSGSRWVVL